MKPLYDKFAYIQELVKNKKVLDIGVVCHDVNFNEEWYRNQFLHDYLCKSAQSVIGLDIEEKGVETLKKSGYNVILADAENMDLGETFDVIVAGDVIEHLSNPGNFVKCAYNHLNDGGILIIVTPNPFNLRRCIYRFFGKQTKVNSQHTLWFDIQTLSQLCERFGFKLAEYRYVQHIPSHWNIIGKLRTKIIYRFEHHCSTIICVFKKKKLN